MPALVPFKITLFAIVEVFIIGLVGFILVKRNIVSKDGLDLLSRILIDVLLPSLIFYTMIKKFDFASFSYWWIWPVACVVIMIFAYAVAALACRLNKGILQKREFIALNVFQNSGNLVLPLLTALLAGPQLDTAFIYVFLFLLAYNIVLWSIGPRIITGHNAKGSLAAGLVNMPFAAVVAALVFLAFGLGKFIPQFLLRPMGIIGNCTIPFAPMIIGGILATISFKKEHISINTFASLILSKLVIMPVAALLLLMKLKLPALVGLVILIEAAVPSATTPAIIARYYKGDYEFISQAVFVTHIASLFTMPVFISLFYLFCA